MSHRKIFEISTFLFYLTVFSIHHASAEVFHWLDSDGKEHYSSHAPKVASSVEKVKGKTFSRYSTEKLLKPLKKYTTPLKVEEKDIISSSTKAEQIKNKNQARALLADEPIISEIEKSGIKLELTEDKKVKSCSMTLKNTSAIPATNVIVSFEFEDGTLIPAMGPASIAPESSAVYKISDENLPLAIKPSEPNLGIQNPVVDVKLGN